MVPAGLPWEIRLKREKVPEGFGWETEELPWEIGLKREKVPEGFGWELS